VNCSLGFETAGEGVAQGACALSAPQQLYHQGARPPKTGGGAQLILHGYDSMPWMWKAPRDLKARAGHKQATDMTTCVLEL